MIAPVGVDSFFDKSWEKRPLHIKRGKPEYYKNVFSTKAFDGILRGKFYSSHVLSAICSVTI